MHWQDWIFTIGTLIFVASLIPSITGPNKPSVYTSIPSAIVLAIFSLTYISLSFWFSAIATTTTAICWSILAIQKHKITKK